MRNHYSVNLERTINELRGVACLDLESECKAKKDILCSRSFGCKVISFDEISIALSSHVERAAKKLRKENRLATLMSIYIKTNRYAKRDRQYRKSSFSLLNHATNDTVELNKTAMSLLSCIWRDGYAYQKMGVMLHGLIKSNEIQYELFNP